MEEIKKCKDFQDANAYFDKLNELIEAVNSLNKLEERVKGLEDREVSYMNANNIAVFDAIGRIQKLEKRCPEWEPEHKQEKQDMVNPFNGKEPKPSLAENMRDFYTKNLSSYAMTSGAFIWDGVSRISKDRVIEEIETWWKSNFNGFNHADQLIQRIRSL